MQDRNEIFKKALEVLSEKGIEGEEARVLVRDNIKSRMVNQYHAGGQTKETEVVPLIDDLCEGNISQNEDELVSLPVEI